MGHRVTRAAGHLSPEEVALRIQTERHVLRRKHWQIIDEALRAPRTAEEIARTVGTSVKTVHWVVSLYNRRGVAALEAPSKGGRYHRYLTVEQEHTFLEPFVVRAARGEVATITEIHHAFEERVGRKVAASTVYRVLSRQGWKKPRTGFKARTESAPAPEDTAEQVRTALQQKRTMQDLSPKPKHPPKWSRYPSDLSDAQWAILEPLIPQAKPGGHPRTVEMREILNAILYVLCTGCQWRALPRDFPPWSTVWSYFRRWRISGEWERIHTTLREQLRTSMEREATPSAAIIDSQSVKTTEKGGCAGMMEGKRSKGANGISWSIPMGW